MRSRPAVVLLSLTLLLTAASCGDDDSSNGAATTSMAGDSDSPATTERLGTDSISTALREPHTSVVARAVAEEVVVLEEPSTQSAVMMSLPRYDPDYVGEDGTRSEQVFLVDAFQDGWLKVLLPVRPNGTTGWISLDDVEVTTHDYEIVVELAAHKMTTTKGGEVYQEADIAVGTRDTPTPGGRFYLNTLLQPPDPDTVYGTYAYGLSGYSDTLERFAGGDGVIGIHGTNDPSVVGSDVSHGCIRMRNEDIEALVEVLPLGTPVEIRA